MSFVLVGASGLVGAVVTVSLESTLVSIDAGAVACFSIFLLYFQDTSCALYRASVLYLLFWSSEDQLHLVRLGSLVDSLLGPV